MGKLRHMDLQDFLLARIGEEEQQARHDLDAPATSVEAARRMDLCRARRRLALRLAADRRVRRVADDLLALLAQRYADHPDYERSWASTARPRRRSEDPRP